MVCRATCIDSSLLNGAFETLYRVMERDVGFIVPPKKARRYTKPMKVHRLLRNVKKRLSLS